MAVAQSRVGALESAGKVSGGVGACMDALHVSRRALRYSVAVGAGFVGLKVARRLLKSLLPRAKSRSVAAPAAPAKAPAGVSAPTVSGGLLKYLVAQGVTLVLLPWLRDLLMRGVLQPRLDYWKPSRIFFRWIGLEK